MAQKKLANTMSFDELVRKMKEPSKTESSRTNGNTPLPAVLQSNEKIALARTGEAFAQGQLQHINKVKAQMVIQQKMQSPMKQSIEKAKKRIETIRKSKSSPFASALKKILAFAAFAAVLYYAFKDYFDTTMPDFVDWIKRNTKDVFEKFKDLLTKAISLFSSSIEKVRNFILESTGEENIGSLISNVVKDVLHNAVDDYIGSMLSSLNNFFKSQEEIELENTLNVMKESEKRFLTLAKQDKTTLTEELLRQMLEDNEQGRFYQFYESIKQTGATADRIEEIYNALANNELIKSLLELQKRGVLISNKEIANAIENATKSSNINLTLSQYKSGVVGADGFSTPGYTIGLHSLIFDALKQMDVRNEQTLQIQRQAEALKSEASKRSEEAAKLLKEKDEKRMKEFNDFVHASGIAAQIEGFLKNEGFVKIADKINSTLNTEFNKVAAAFLKAQNVNIEVAAQDTDVASVNAPVYTHPIEVTDERVVIHNYVLNLNAIDSLVDTVKKNDEEIIKNVTSQNNTLKELQTYLKKKIEEKKQAKKEVKEGKQSKSETRVVFMGDFNRGSSIFFANDETLKLNLNAAILS